MKKKDEKNFKIAGDIAAQMKYGQQPHLSNLKRKMEKLEKIDLELTNYCNLECKHCYMNANQIEKGNKLSFEKAIQIIQEFSEIGGRRIALTGGEPLLHDKFLEIFNFIVDNGIKIELETNGFFLNKNLVKNLSKHRENIRYVQISLDGPEKIHDMIRGLKGSFKRAINAIELCLKEEINVRVSTVLIKQNKDSIFEIFEILKKLSVTDFRVDAGVPTGRGRNVAISVNEYINVVKKLNELMGNDNNGKVITPSCGVGETRVAVTVNGAILPCPMIRDLIAGNAFNYGELSVALNSEAIKKVRDGLENSCGNCKSRKICGRGCKARAYAITKNLNSPDIFRCALFKKRKE